jgi:exodeoxyribonuclease V gamma subunit
MTVAQGIIPRQFEVYFSNRMEVLLECLGQVISAPLSSPFDKEIILVQSKGLERWLVQQLAHSRGIWANGSFPFPNAMMRQIFSALLGPLPDISRFSPDVLAWRILGLLPACTRRPGFESLANYLSGDHGGLKSMQLSRKIADVFDQYTLYRPEMVLEWEAGRSDDWQAQLWRELTNGCSDQHRAAQRREVLDRIEHELPGAIALPARLSVFGIPVLPPFHLDILYALSRHIRICLFLLNPCREYWGDLTTRQQEYREKSKAALRGSPVEESHIEVGNALLSSMGLQGRQFLNLLLDKEEVLATSAYRDPGEDSLLACMQSDILTLQDRGRDTAKTPLAANDASIQIHSMHSPMREMEALHDYLLSLFDANRELEPRDIVVMTPQIETYAPYISAVFSASEDARKRIPFSIADRSPKSESLVIQAFLKMLRLCRSRFGATEVMDLLETPPVRARFDLAPGDLETIQGWIAATGIRWGIDGADRTRFGVPHFDENSWQEGLKRLLVGYALPQEKDQFFENILPYDDVEGSESQVLGRFVDFALALFERIRDLESPRTAQEWQSALLDLLDRFILADEDTERDAQMLRSVLHDIATDAGLAGFTGQLGIEAVRQWLEEHLQAEGWSQGFLTGGVTFCEMLPMRSIPFRVVALVGMDSTAFPRQGRPPGFDLIAQDPRPGDRSLRDEDRYLFLEALLSARERLYISYVGQSIQDNSEIPPSPLVNELLDYVEQGFMPAPPAQTIQQQLVVRHRLQAFSQEYFAGGNQLFSYSQDNLNALRAREEKNAQQAPFMRFPTADPTEDWRSLDIRDLRRFFRQPVEFFLHERLGIRLERPSVRAEDCEPFSLDGLNRYAVEQEISQRLLGGEDISGLAAVIRSRGVLPPGTVGEVLYRQSLQEAAEFVRKVQPLLEEMPPLAREIRIDIGGFRLSGTIRDFRGNLLLHYRCADIKPKDLLAAWIDHLAWNVAAGATEAATTVLAGKDHCYQFSPTPECAKYLTVLLEAYWEGLKKPLHYFPRSSFAYAEAVQGQEVPGRAMSAAENIWRPQSKETPGEGDEPYNKLAFRNCDPLDEDFEELALAILEPLLTHREKR